MASQRLAQSVLRCTSTRLITTAPRVTLVRARNQFQSNTHSYRYLHTTQTVLAETSKPAEAIKTPAEPVPEPEPEPAKHAAFLGEADSDDGFQANKDAFGDPEPSLDAQNSAFHGEADSDDGFEASKVVDGEKLEAVDASNASFLGEADSDDGFVAHRDAHPEEADHKIENPQESGLHGQPGEQDMPAER